MAASIKISELQYRTSISPDDLLLVTDYTGEGGRPRSSKLSLGDLQSYYLDSLKATVDSLVALSGTTADSNAFGEFTGDIVDDGATVKSALQQLESSILSLKATVEAADAALQANIDALNYISPLDNINELRAKTEADETPDDYSYIVVDNNTGELKVIDDKTLKIIPG